MMKVLTTAKMDAQKVVLRIYPSSGARHGSRTKSRLVGKGFHTRFTTVEQGKQWELYGLKRQCEWRQRTEWRSLWLLGDFQWCRTFSMSSNQNAGWKFSLLLNFKENNSSQYNDNFLHTWKFSGEGSVKEWHWNLSCFVQAQPAPRVHSSII